MVWWELRIWKKKPEFSFYLPPLKSLTWSTSQNYSRNSLAGFLIEVSYVYNIGLLWGLNNIREVKLPKRIYSLDFQQVSVEMDCEKSVDSFSILNSSKQMSWENQNNFKCLIILFFFSFLDINPLKEIPSIEAELAIMILQQNMLLTILMILRFLPLCKCSSAMHFTHSEIPIFLLLENDTNNSIT